MRWRASLELANLNNYVRIEKTLTTSFDVIQSELDFSLEHLGFIVNREWLQLVIENPEASVVFAFAQ